MNNPSLGSPALVLDRITLDGHCRVRVVGELDVCTAGQLIEGLDEARQNSDGDIVLDLRDCSFCDAAGLRAFVTAHLALRAAGRRLLLDQPSAMLRRLLKVTGLDAALELCSPTA